MKASGWPDAQATKVKESVPVTRLRRLLRENIQVCFWFFGGDYTPGVYAAHIRVSRLAAS